MGRSAHEGALLVQLNALFVNTAKEEEVVFRRGRSRRIPKHVKARVAQDEEKRTVLKPARSIYAADWVSHVRTVVES